MRGFIDGASLLVRAADTHIRYFAPAAESMTPPQYAGKTETACAVMALEVLDVSVGDMPDPQEFARFVAGLNLLIRANDEVVDEVAPYADETVTPEQLNTTPVFHKFAGPEGRLVTGSEGMQVAMDATAKLIPGNSLGSIKRRTAIEAMLTACTQAAADTANNPEYSKGDVLPFPVAEQVKYETNGFLGETCIELVATLLDIPGTDKERELYRQIGVALQFGDDLFDWRRDWSKHRAKAEEADRPVRAQQNMFNATLLEFPDRPKPTQHRVGAATGASSV
jgi:hypothetical protein